MEVKVLSDNAKSIYRLKVYIAVPRESVFGSYVDSTDAIHRTHFDYDCKHKAIEEMMVSMQPGSRVEQDCNWVIQCKGGSSVQNISEIEWTDNNGPTTVLIPSKVIGEDITEYLKDKYNNTPKAYKYLTKDGTPARYRIYDNCVSTSKNHYLTVFDVKMKSLISKCKEKGCKEPERDADELFFSSSDTTADEIVGYFIAFFGELAGAEWRDAKAKKAHAPIDDEISTIIDRLYPENADQSLTWIVAIGNSEVDNVITEIIKGNKSQAKTYLADLAKEDRDMGDEAQWDAGTENPSEVEEREDGSLYANGMYRNYHIDYIARPMDTLKIVTLSENSRYSLTA